MLGDHIFDHNVPLGHCRCKHKGSGLDLVRDDGIITPLSLLTPLIDHIRTCTLDVGAHTVQKIGKIHYMGLLGCIFNNGLSFCPGMPPSLH